MELLNQVQPNQPVEVTVWSANSEEEIMFRTTVLEAVGELFLLDLPSHVDPRVFELMQPGVIVGVVMYSAKPCIFYPTVHVYQPRSPRGFWLKIMPDTQVETLQRRQFVRVNMCVPITILYPGISEEDWLEVQGQTIDVSGGGMRFGCPKMFEKDQEIKIRVQFGKSQLVLTLPARIVFSRENRNRQSDVDVYETACQFFDLTEHQQTLIVGECFRRELEMK